MNKKTGINELPGEVDRSHRDSLRLLRTEEQVVSFLLTHAKQLLSGPPFSTGDVVLLSDRGAFGVDQIESLLIKWITEASELLGITTATLNSTPKSIDADFANDVFWWSIDHLHEPLLFVISPSTPEGQKTACRFNIEEEIKSSLAGEVFKACNTAVNCNELRSSLSANCQSEAFQAEALNIAFSDAPIECEVIHALLTKGVPEIKLSDLVITCATLIRHTEKEFRREKIEKKVSAWLDDLDFPFPRVLTVSVGSEDEEFSDHLGYVADYFWARRHHSRYTGRNSIFGDTDGKRGAVVAIGR